MWKPEIFESSNLINLTPAVRLSQPLTYVYVTLCEKHRGREQAPKRFFVGEYVHAGLW